MKNLLIVLFALIGLHSYAAGPRKFYCSSSLGNDINTGLLSTSPVQSITKLNTLIATAVGGDSIFLRAGDVFYGAIVINRSGLQGNPIVLASYGTGANPIITGLITLGSWTNLGGNIWQASTTNVKITNNLVLRDGVVQQIGRYPNTNAANGGYLVYTTSTQTSITGPALSTTTNWTGAEVAVRINRWTIRRRTVTAHAAGLVSFATMNYTPKANYGYFFQRDARTLDQDGEWYQAASSLRMYFGNNNPNVYTVKVPNIDTLIKVMGSHITIRGIDCDGSSINGIYAQGTASNITIQNCNITNSGGDGITTWFCSKVLVENCATNYCLTTGIRVRSSIVTAGVTQYTNSLIRNNTVNHTSEFAGMETLEGTQSGGSGNGIAAFGGDSVRVLNNIVKNSGYNGIQWYARSHAYIKYNFIDTFCTTRDDGGGIYTYEAEGAAIYEGTERKIISNIIDHAIGNANGGGSEPASANGIYNDEGTWGIVADSNTVANTSYHAFQGNDNGNMSFRYNTVYHAGAASVSFQRLAKGSPPITGNIIKFNIFDYYWMRFRDQARNVPTTVSTEANLLRLGDLNNNWYSTKTGVDTSVRAQTQTNPTSSYVEIWRPMTYLTGTVGLEINSINFANTGTLYYNAANTVRTVLFNGLSYKDPKGTVYNNFVTIPAWDSRILIANGTINTPPTANAGVDKAITSPTSTVSVTGSGNDADGTISSYSWTKVSGPIGGTIASPTSATTNINLLQVGTYVFQLTVTDNGGLTGSDIMRVIVSAANIAPTANAGADITITSPASTTTLTGSGTDPDGSIASYAWAKISGPAGGTITSASSASTGLTALGVGTYVYQLTVTDNGGLTNTDLVQVIVEAANVSPVADAGRDTTITLPVNSVTITGSGSDADGTISSYAWSKVLGPIGGTIASASSATTAINLLQAGTYVYSLTVTDNDGATGVNTMQIVVNAANIPPTANAGSKIDITLPVSTTTLNGSGTDQDGTIVSYAWSKISGPSGGTINSPTTASTAISALQEGTYVFQLTVTDNSGATGTSTVQVEVHPAIPPANENPTVNASADKTIRLPANAVTTTAVGADTDGTIVSYSWSKIAGPVSYTITNPNSATTNFTDLTVGTYTFQVQVTDDDGGTAVDEIQVTVNAANLAPIANAGSDTVITSPTSSYTLVGSGSDPDGSIVSYAWSKVSGPSGGSTSATTASTTVAGLNVGVYLYQLTVTDNDGAIGSKTMQLTVNAANIPPVATAGFDKTVTLPVTTTTLNGLGIDQDGTIASYLWTKLDGPTGGTISSASTASTGITALQEGVYTYQLTVTDNSGATGTSSVQVKVNAENIFPSAGAGNDTTIVLPINSVRLNGTGSDPEGSVTYSWTQESGPSTANIASPLNAITDVTGLEEGVYIFQITVTDGSGATSSDAVQITVQGAVNSSPLVSIDQSDTTIILPVNSLTLSGTGSDAEGGVTYLWTGSGGTIETPDDSTTVISGLTEGTYLFTLTVTDEDGASTSRSVVVTVLPVPVPSTGPQGLILWKAN